jgi:hypothetical protein
MTKYLYLIDKTSFYNIVAMGDFHKNCALCKSIINRDKTLLMMVLGANILFLSDISSDLICCDVSWFCIFILLFLCDNSLKACMHFNCYYYCCFTSCFSEYLYLYSTSPSSYA